MDVVEAVSTRRTIRRFSPRPVADTTVAELLDAARRAPSASNTQPWRFVVVRDETRRAELAQAAGGQTSVETAPVVIVICGDAAALAPAARMRRYVEFSRAGMDDEMESTGVAKAVAEMAAVRQKEAEQDGAASTAHVSLAGNVAIAVSFMILRAHELGLGSCWLGAFSRARAREIAGVPDSMEVLWLLALGYPDIAPVERPRLSVEQFVRYEMWETE